MGGGGALLGVLIGTFPSLLRLPNPLSKAAATLRSELGRIARDVWGTDKAARRGQARILEMMGELRLPTSSGYKLQAMYD
jgi:hypothetical protein